MDVSSELFICCPGIYAGVGVAHKLLCERPLKAFRLKL